MRKLMRPERGAILIHVGLAIFMLAAMSAFVLDYGVLWLSRRQAQNAADAGALAGAVARAYDETANPPAGNGPAYQSASQTALANPVIGAGATAEVLWDCPPYVTAGPTDCVHVNVYRDGLTDSNGNPNGSTALPVWFAPLFGINSQRIKATATAWATTGNTTNCMRPFSVADKWVENGTPDPLAYERWVSAGGGATELTPHDVYTPPSTTSSGTGYVLPADYGAPVLLKGGNNPNSSSGGAITPGWFLPVQLPDPDGGYFAGGDDYRDAIGNCTAGPVTIGQYLPTETGAMVGPTSQGVGDLIARDPGASWTSTPAPGAITGSCAPGCAPMSPRIVPIAVFDMDEWQYRIESGDWNDAFGNPVCPIGGRCVKVVNILGFFVQGMTGQDVNGILMTMPGELVAAGPVVGGGAGFLQVIQLIR